MLAKFFILAVAILGIATKLASGVPAHVALAQAYRDTIAGAVSLKFTIWRAANCANEGTINRRMTTTAASRVCKFCVCGVAAADDGESPTNCDAVPCFQTGAPALTAVAVEPSWNTPATPPVAWTSIRNATAFQVYTVDDGFCYVTEIDTTTGRTMKCFAHR